MTPALFHAVLAGAVRSPADIRCPGRAASARDVRPRQLGAGLPLRSGLLLPRAGRAESARCPVTCQVTVVPSKSLSTLPERAGRAPAAGAALLRQLERAAGAFAVSPNSADASFRFPGLPSAGLGRAPRPPSAVAPTARRGAGRPPSAAPRPFLPSCSLACRDSPDCGPRGRMRRTGGLAPVPPSAPRAASPCGFCPRLRSASITRIKSGGGERSSITFSPVAGWTKPSSSACKSRRGDTKGTLPCRM